ncbi:phage coat protein, partial [Clostridium botulinum]
LKGNAEIKNAFSSQTGTAYAVLPMYGRIDGDALNYDGQTDITATSTTTFERGVVVVGRAKAWVESDFSEDITGGVNFMDNVGNQVGEYWDDVDQGTLLSILKGIYSMTGAKNLEFVNNHTLDITTLADDKNVVGSTTLNTAIQKASGDNKSKFTLAIMHSAVATNLENLKLLAYLKYTDETGIERELQLATWNGRTVLIDDSMPVEEVAKTGDVEAYT